MDARIQAMIGLGRAVRDRVRLGLRQPDPRLAEPAHAAAGDLQYGIDRLSEDGLAREVAARFAGLGPLRLLSEGMDASGVEVVPGAGGSLLVVDPIDGTRGLMHDKRSAFFLAALAPDGPAARLRDVTHAVMVEIPATRSDLSDVLAATTDGGPWCFTDDLRTGGTAPFAPRPSGATGLRHGFATVVRFFSGAATALGAVHDELLRRLHPDDAEARQDAFEDQYISNGGQFHALITGRDRFVADLRPLFRTAEGAPLRCSHPYDVCAALIARRAGVVLTDDRDEPLDAPLDLTTRVAWVGYASEALRRRVAPHLAAILARLPGRAGEGGAAARRLGDPN